jgi:hypothetical protein
VPVTELSYLVYTVDRSAGDVIWYRPLLVPDDFNQATRPNVGDENRIDLGSGFDIKAFYALPLTAQGHVMIIFEDVNERLWRLVHDFVNHVVVEPFIELFGGRRPALDFDGILRLLYIQGEDVVMRNDFGDELNLVRPSERDIRDFDTKFKFGVSVLRYAGSHFLTNDIALIVVPDANTLVVYDGEIGPTGVTAEFQDDINPGQNFAIPSESAQFTLKASMPGGGIQGDGFAFPGGAGLVGRLQAQGSFWQAGLDEITVMTWTYGDPAFPLTSSFLNGSGLNVHLPWSNSHVYWDAPYPDRINYNAGTTTESAWRHWAFTKNIATGTMRIYMDGNQTHSGTGFTLPMTGGSVFNLVSNWNGWISEMAIASKELTQPQIAAARALGLADTPLSLASVPDLIHYWPLNENPGDGFLDKSGNGYDAALPSVNWLTSGEGAQAIVDNSFTVGAFPWPGALTLELWMEPQLQARSITPFSGAVTLELKNTGIIEFRFGATIWRGRRYLEQGRRVHLAVSHVFGDGSGTFVTVDGEVVQGDWVTGDGTESPALAGNLSCQIGRGDKVFQFRISDIARSLAYIRDHVGGRA